MTKPRKLVDGIASSTEEKEREFVYQASRRLHPAPPNIIPKPPARSPLTTRIREDYARSIKQISLQRQLDGVEPNTLQDILEEAIGAWLADNDERRGD